MKNYLNLLKLIKGHQSTFGVAIIFIIFSSLFEGLQLTFILPVVDRCLINEPIKIPHEDQLPLFFRHLIEKLNSIDPHTLLPTTILCFMIFFSVGQVVSFFSNYFMNDVAQAVMRDVRYRLFERIQTLSLDYFGNKRTGELVSRITNDVGVIENGISYAITDLFKQPILIVVMMVLAFKFNPKGTLIVLLLFPAIGWPMALINKKLRKIQKHTGENG